MKTSNPPPPFDLPAGAPKTCPACGKEWTTGYIVKKRRHELGATGPKKVYEWVLVCRNLGCGLGFYRGSEITRAEAEGLELIDRESRKKEVLRVAEDETKKRPWSKEFDCCRDCGGTDEPHFGRGLCRVCYNKHTKAGTLSRFPATKPGRKKRAAGPAAAPTCTVALPEDLYRFLETLGRISNATVDKVAAVVIRNYLGDLGISAGAAGKKP